VRSAQKKYWLSPHVYVCVTDDYAVLLDLRRDKYIGVRREHMPTLAASVIGWPATAQTAVEPASSAKALMDDMIATGMLTTDGAIGKEAQSLVIPQPQFPAVEADLEYRPHMRVRNASRMLVAAAKARALLKCCPIEAVVARVKRRKEQQCEGSEFDLAAARPLVEQFLYLRPLVFTTKDECLFDSLVLIELLARNHLFPVWLFGVATNPFRAHSWVQAGDRVLNDTPERVSRFTPILAV
jgi:Transglutaminase-like superfamily